MKPVWLVLPLWLLAAAAVAWGINTWLRGQPSLVGDDPDPLAVTRVVLTLVGGVGAVFVGVYAYRKQRIEEAASLRADHDQFLSRYNAATEQLAHPSAAARLAGVYAMAQLADDWASANPEDAGTSRRQQCVDVLCAYLRMPPRADDPGDAEVRATVLAVITEHVNKEPGDANSWSALNFDFSRAEFRDVLLRGRFEQTVLFRGATFTGRTTFGRLIFERGASFYQATFENLSARGCRFPGVMLFARATFASRVSFEKSRFEAWADFSYARFAGEYASFGECIFRGDGVTFEGADFAGNAYFVWATFRGDLASFAHSTFHARAHFERAQIMAEAVDFQRTSFEGEVVSFEECDIGTETDVEDEGVNFTPGCTVVSWEHLAVRGRGGGIVEGQS